MRLPRSRRLEQKVWPKGTRFRVKQWYGVDISEHVAPHLEFCNVRHAGIHDLIWHDTRFYALVTNASEVPESFSEFMEREDIRGYTAKALLERMEADGMTTRKFLVALRDKINAESDAESEARQKDKARVWRGMVSRAPARG